MPRRVQTGAERTEHLVAGELVAALDRLGLGRRQQHGQVVAGLAVTGGEHFAGDRFLEQPHERTVAVAVEVGGDAGPVDVHVRRQRGGGGVVREARGLAADLGEREAETAELHRHRHEEVAGSAELLEVLVEETVVAVVLGGAAGAAVEDVLRQHVGTGDHGHVWVLSLPGERAALARELLIWRS